ncbi:TPM domain-containing protein [Psychrobacter sp. F1192]|uniref:TPM domain-containing protein n=1 Tax=Psychrobacter coccoides TaxID=2818440 RepID=A0ABS3NRH3_9GAMM|nr:TPM domain-containing protein [Psychrobacter coccoides]MBO1532015.1 TPM domain-containing protein [Psychrobacter coccoides]
MKLFSRYVSFKKGVALTTFLIAHLALSGCNSAADSIQNTENKTSKAQALTAEPYTPVSLIDEQSKSRYIAPETLGEQLKSPVNDFTSTLSHAEIEFLNEKLKEVYKEGLLQMGVVLVATTEDMPIFDYAMTVAKSWALGSPDNNNGLLIFLALDDKQMYILTGLDIEETLTDETVAQIIDKDITPHFRKANYVTGLSAGIDALVWKMRQHQ